MDLYDFFYFPDDDILIKPRAVDKLFELMSKFELDLAQPSLLNLHFTFDHTVNKPNSMCRYTNFVEIMQPCFSRDALKQVLWTFNESMSGWGLDFHWGQILNFRRQNVAIIDLITSIHTRPVQSNHHEELNSYLIKFNLRPQIITQKVSNTTPPPGINA